MKTDPIYLTDSYKQEMNASIVEVYTQNNEFRVVLDQTVFYPMGGGQPTDQGQLKLENGNSLEVYQVMIKDGEIWHYIKDLKGLELNVGDKVFGTIDWDRRYKNMKVHSAGHIIDFAIYLLNYSPKTLSPFKGDHGKKPYIIYNGVVNNPDLKNQIEQRSNELIQQGLNFSWEFLPLEELEKKAIYLQPGLPSNKPLRALTLEGIGTVADGGTQIHNSNETGKIAITKIDISNNQTTVHYNLTEDTKNSTEEAKKAQSSEQIMDSNIDLAVYGIDQQSILKTIETEVQNTQKEDDLIILWRKYLGREGEVTLAFKKISEVKPEDRKAFGISLNQLKNEIDKKISEGKEKINSSLTSEYLKTQQAKLDLKKSKIGHLHPLTETTNTLNQIFLKLGYSIMDGPEIESDEYCFQRLNVPMDHPARDLQDSIYIEEPNILLRTQTSSIEARVLETYKPPFKVVMPGRVYRNEKVNKSNHFTFHQYQLVCVQEKVSLAELFATINYLFKTFLGEDVVTRFRNKYYPEVEPGVGPDMQCFNCHGEGHINNERCGVCKGRGWMEMGGAGIIHPNVLKMAGLDPEKWQGYAFGLGLDRWAMAKHNITDIRTLLDGNLAYKPN